MIQACPIETQPVFFTDTVLGIMLLIFFVGVIFLIHNRLSAMEKKDKEIKALTTDN